MKKINIALLIISVLAAAGCYKDLGNYDYEDIQRLEIKFEYNVYNRTIGDLLEIKPIYPEIIDQHPENYEFQWIFDDETRPEWNTRDFVWTADEIKDRARLVIEVTDVRNDMVYMNYTNVNVTAVYTNDYSWMILSDEGGKSKLSFLSVTDFLDNESEEYPEGSNQDYYNGTRFIKNVFNGELGTGPISMQEHWREGVDWNETVVGNVCIFQESGAVDLEGTGFTKEIDMKDAFVNQTYPSANTVLRPGSFMNYVDVVCDQDGKLYSRLKLSSQVYNSEYFLPSPLTVKGEDEVLENCTVCRGFYMPNRLGNQVVYDGKNKRMLFVKDGTYWDAVGASMITPVQTDEDVVLKDVVPMDNHSGYELLYISECGDSYPNYGFFEVLKSETDGRLYIQKFVAGQASWGAPYTVCSIKKNEILGLPGEPSAIAFPIYTTQEYAFFAVGQDLYMVDLVNMDVATLYYHFESKITALDYGSRGNIHVAVGLEDGSFFVLGANQAKNIKEEHKLIYPRTDEEKKNANTGGKIVDIKFKNNSMWNY